MVAELCEESAFNPISTPPMAPQSAFNTAAIYLFQSFKSNHVTLLFRILQWCPISLLSRTCRPLRIWCTLSTNVELGTHPLRPLSPSFTRLQAGFLPRAPSAAHLKAMVYLRLPTPIWKLVTLLPLHIKAVLLPLLTPEVSLSWAMQLLKVGMERWWPDRMGEHTRLSVWWGAQWALRWETLTRSLDRYQREKDQAKAEQAPRCRAWASKESQHRASHTAASAPQLSGNSRGTCTAFYFTDFQS